MSNEKDYFLCICGFRIEHDKEETIKCLKCKQKYMYEKAETLDVEGYIMFKPKKKVFNKRR